MRERERDERVQKESIERGSKKNELQRIRLLFLTYCMHTVCIRHKGRINNGTNF